MRLLIDFKLDSYGKLVEFLLPENNYLIKSKLTILFDKRNVSSVLPIYQKCVQECSQLDQNCFVFQSYFKNKFIHFRMNKCKRQRGLERSSP